MTTKPYSCWSCKYFHPDDVTESVEGHCHRYAPHALDYYGFSGVEVVSPLEAKGDIYTYSTEDDRLPVGTDGQILSANSATDTGLEWIDNIELPLTTKGDVLSRTDTENVRVGVGSDGQVLTADAASAAGVKWTTPSAAGSPLTTKGDIYGFDTDDTRIPVGTDDQVLTADSTQASGVAWKTPASGSSPLTTKGDLYGYSTTDTRVAVGTDGQILIADSAEAEGVKWADNSGDYKILALQSSIIGTKTGTGETSTYREGNLPSGELPVSGQYINYDTEGMLPFHVPPNAELVAVGLNLTKGAVGGASVGANPYLKIYFYDRSGSGYTNLGGVDFPIPAAYVGYNSDVGTANYYSAIEKLSTTLGPFPNRFLGLHVVLDTSDTERIYAVHNCTITAYVKIPISDILDSSLLAVASLAASEATASSDASEPALAAATESGTVLLSLTTGTTPTSAGKWSVIYDASVMWCGKYRRRPGTIPPIP